MPVGVANFFNDHFSTIAKKLINKLPLSRAKFTDYLPPFNPTSMFITPTNIFEIKRLIYKLKPKLSTGIDQTPIVFKHLPDNALYALSYIFNQSLRQGKYISMFNRQGKYISMFNSWLN